MKVAAIERLLYVSPEPTERLADIAEAVGALVGSDISRAVRSLYTGPRANLLFALCHETSTHYKWMLGMRPDGRGRVWLHEYKALDVNPESYAEVPHDHRYSFVSTIVTGGYVEEYWRRSPGDRVEPERLVPRGPGETHAVNHDAVHSLRDVQPGTTTVLVEGAEQKSASTSWRRDGRLRGKHETFMSRFDSIFGS